MVKINASKIEIQSSDESPYIDLYPEVGKTLRISGVSIVGGTGGTDKSVQFNDEGITAGDEEFLYDKTTTELTVPIVIPETITGKVPSDTLGYNEIYRNYEYEPQSITTQFTTDLKDFGTDIEISKSANYIVSACPNWIYGASLGGCSVFNETAGVFNENASYLTYYPNFSLEANTNYSSINEDGTISAMSLSDLDGTLTINTRSGTTWTKHTKILGCVGMKLSGDLTNCYMLSYDTISRFNIHYFNGTTWTFQLELYDNGTGAVDYPIAISGDTCVISTGTNIIAYRRAGTFWYEYNNFSIAGAQSLDLSGDKLVVVAGGDTVYMYDDFMLVNTLTAPDLRYCTTNGVHTFITDIYNKIYCISKIDGLYSLSVNTTEYIGATKLSCNDEYLTVASPSTGNGQAMIYKIEFYVNHPVPVSNIVMNDPSDISIESILGSVSVNSSEVILSGNLSVSDGTISEPSIKFTNEPGMGLYKNATGEMSVVVNGEQSAIFKEEYSHINKLRVITNGNATNPAYGFKNYTRTGMFTSGGTSVNFTMGGIMTLSLNSEGNSNYAPVLIPNGTNALPSLSFTNNPNTGIFWVSTDSFGVVVGGVGINQQWAPNSIVFARNLVQKTNNLTYNSFLNGSGTVIGSITTPANVSVSYNTTSSRKLKENIEPMMSGIDLVRRMNPCEYHWKADTRKERKKSCGFIADEMREIMPEIVTDEREEVDADGINRTIPEQLDYSKLTPVLCCAIKFLDSQNTKYKMRIGNLETLVATLVERLDALEKV